MTEREIVEVMARAIYETWSQHTGYVPWVEQGNSLKQNDARYMARKAYEAQKLAEAACRASALEEAAKVAENQMMWRTLDDAARACNNAACANIASAIRSLIPRPADGGDAG